MVKLATLDPSHPGIYIADKLIDCQRCGFCHLYPLPDPATVDRYYEGDCFYAGDNPHSPPDWLDKERKEYEAGLWDAYYGYLAGLLDPYEDVIDWGCGAGWFLDYLWRRLDRSQYSLYGIEPSRTARRHSPIAHRLYEKISKEVKSYQILERGDYMAVRGNIILSLVLEHIPDPARFLQEDVLPHLDGRLVVVVPNEWNPLQRHIINRETKLGASFDWMRFELKHKVSGATYHPWFVSSVHVNYFNPASLRGLLERCGLTVTHTGATFPMELFILAGKDHRNNDEQGRRNHLWRLQLERKWPGVFRLYEWLGRLGIGREIVMTCHLPDQRTLDRPQVVGEK